MFNDSDGRLSHLKNTNRLLQDVTSEVQMDALVASWNNYDVNRSGDPDSQAERYGSVVLSGRDDCESFHC
jgi:hypothetical protein